ncbi:hypothetical protein P9112_002599 [Eukaryota sp. TZLM1-RC]
MASPHDNFVSDGSPYTPLTSSPSPHFTTVSEPSSALSSPKLHRDRYSQLSPDEQRWKIHDRLQSAKQKRSEHLRRKKDVWKREQEKINLANQRREEKKDQILHTSEQRQRSAQARREQNMKEIKDKTTEQLSKVSEALFVHNLAKDSRSFGIHELNIRKQANADDRRKQMLKSQTENLKLSNHDRIEKAQKKREMIEAEKIEKFKRNEEKREFQRGKVKSSPVSYRESQEGSIKERVKNVDTVNQLNDFVGRCEREGQILGSEFKSKLETCQDYLDFCDSNQGIQLINLIAEFQLLVTGLVSEISSSPSSARNQKFKNFQRIIQEITKEKYSVSSETVAKFLIATEFIDCFFTLIASSSLLNFEHKKSLLSIVVSFLKELNTQMIINYIYLSKKFVIIISLIINLIETTPKKKANSISLLLFGLIEFVLYLFSFIGPNSHLVYENCSDFIDFSLQSGLFKTMLEYFYENLLSDSKMNLVFEFFHKFALFFDTLIIHNHSISESTLRSGFVSSILTSLFDTLSAIVLSICDTFATKSFRETTQSLPSSPFTHALRSARNIQVSNEKLLFIASCLSLVNKLGSLQHLHPFISDCLVFNSVLRLEFLHTSSALLALCCANLEEPSYYSISATILDLFVFISKTESGREIFSSFSIGNMNLISRLLNLPFTFFSDSLLKVRLFSVICFCFISERNRSLILEEINPSFLIDFLNHNHSGTYLSIEEKNLVLELLT